jgi:hypothetical protein
MMNIQSSDHPMVREETTLSTVKLTCNAYCVVKYDLQKLLMLSPLVRSVVAELNIPSGLSHLLDVTIMMPGVDDASLLESSEHDDVDESDFTLSNENNDEDQDISSKALVCKKCNSKSLQLNY